MAYAVENHNLVSNYALVEDGTVVNVIWLAAENEHEFPGAVRLGDRPVAVGETYDGEKFYHAGAEVLTPLEKRKREQLLPLLQDWERLLTEALAARCAGTPAPEALQAVRDRRTAPELLAAVEALREAQTYCTANVSPAAVCGALAVKL